MARDLFLSGDHALAAFHATTVIEEVGKLALVGFEELDPGEPPDERAFRSHREKYILAVGHTLFVNSRVTRIYGADEARFAAWFRGGALFAIRNRALYIERQNGALVTPAEAIKPEDAKLLVCIAGEVLAEAQGELIGSGPAEWQAILKEVDAFREGSAAGEP